MLRKIKVSESEDSNRQHKGLSYGYLTLEQLPQGGFRAKKEKQVVTDSRVFGGEKCAFSKGIGNTADANFHLTVRPCIRTDEYDGTVKDKSCRRITRTRTNLEAGSVQVQRAGEGFTLM